MKVRVLSSLVMLGLAGGLVLLMPAPESAEISPAPPAQQEPQVLGAGSLLGGMAVGDVQVSAKDAAARQKLNSLRGHQTAEEIQEIASGDEPAVLLLDTPDGEYVAAYREE